MRSGRITTVREKLRGSVLIVDAAAAATTITLETVADFDDAGGNARLHDDVANTSVIVAYDTLDDDLGTLHLTAGLAGSWSAATTIVDVEPATPDRIAAVIVDDAETELDEVDARVPFGLYDRVPVGDRTINEREAVELADLITSWEIADVLGASPVVDGSFIDTTTLPPNPTDGLPPASSPAPTVTGMVSALFVRWTGVTNADAVDYDVHVSTTSGFTPGAGTLVGVTPSTIATIRTLQDGTALVAGVTYYVKIVAHDADGSAAASAQGSGTLATVTGPDIAVGAITADMIQAGTLASAVVVGGYIGSDEPGAATRHWEADGAGVRLIESDGTVLINLPTDPLQDAAFNGSVRAYDLSVLAGAVLAGASLLDKAATLSLASKIADPAQKPTITSDVEKTDFYTAGTDNVNGRRGLFYDGTNFLYLNENNYQGVMTIYKVSPAGALVNSATLQRHAVGQQKDDPYSCPVKIGSWWYLIANNPDGNTYWSVFADSGGMPGTLNASGLYSGGTGALPLIATDGTDLWVCQSNAPTSNALVFKRYTPPGTGAVPGAATASLTTNTTTYGAASPDGYAVGNGDYGSIRHVIHSTNLGANKCASFDGSAQEQLLETWREAAGSLLAGAIAYDGANYRQLDKSARALYRFTGYNKVRSSATDPVKFYAAYTWYDSAGTVHETKLSPRNSASIYSRRRVTIGWPTIPGSAGADDPDSVRLYMKENANDPGAAFASYFRQGTTFTGTSTIVASYSTATAGSQAAVFPGAVPGVIQSEQAEWSLKGDGTLQVYRTMPKMWHWEEEFIQPPSVAAFNTAASGAGAAVGQQDAIANHQGLWTLDTGTTAAGAAGVFTQVRSYVLANGKIRHGWLLRTGGNLSDATNRYRIVAGLFDGGTYQSGFVDGIYFIYQDNLGTPTGSWEGRAEAANVTTTDPLDDNGGAIAVVATTWYFLELELNAAGSQADFYVNGILKASLVTGLPTVQQRATAQIEKVAGTASRGFLLDAMYGYGELTGARY